MDDLPSFAQALLNRKNERDNIIRKSGIDSMLTVSTIEKPKFTKYDEISLIDSISEMKKSPEKTYEYDLSDGSYCDSDDEALISELNKYKNENKQLKDEIKILRQKLRETVDLQEVEDLRTEKFELCDMLQKEKSKRTIAEEKLKHMTNELKIKDQEITTNRKIIATLNLNLERANEKLRNVKVQHSPPSTPKISEQKRDFRPNQINTQIHDEEIGNFEPKSPDKMSTSAIQRELNDIIPKKDRLANQVMNEFGDQGGVPDENVRRELYDIRRRIGQLQLQLKFRGVIK